MVGGVKSLEISRNGPQSSTQALWILEACKPSRSVISKSDSAFRPTGKSSVYGLDLVCFHPLYALEAQRWATCS